jgi:ketoreductase RED2
VKTAIITGSSSGIGMAIAKGLSKQNYNVVINSVSSIEKGQQLAASLPNAIYIQADVSKPEECEKLINRTIEVYGQLDVLVNNAVFSSPFIEHKDFSALTDEMFMDNFNVNVLGAWRLAKLAQSHLQKSGHGNIINISSIAGLRPIGASIAYAVSKAALNHLTKLLAKAMAPKVRVNAIAPGVINTSRVQSNNAKAVKEQLIDKALLKRIGEPDEISQAVLYLLECQYITGQIHTVDGGTTLK